MPYPEFHFLWEWDLQSSPEQLWPLVSDTNRTNRVSGGPEVVGVREPPAELDPTAGGRAVVRRLSLRKFGVPTFWEEYPFEWVRPYRFGVLREAPGQPIGRMKVLAVLEPKAGGGTHLRYEMWIRPGNLLGLAAIPVQVGALSRRDFDRIFRRSDALARELARGGGAGGAGGGAGAERAPHPYRSGRAHVGGVAAQRLAEAGRVLARQGYSEELIARLAERVTYAQDDEVAHLRAYALADEWGAPRRPTLELCLAATRASLLDMNWNLLCPGCRGIKASVAHLSALASTVHCPACNIAVHANFDHAVEITFRPNAAVRRLAPFDYCVGGPQVTPHVLAQQILGPGERRTLAIALEPGVHRLRAQSARGAPGGCELRVAPPESAGPLAREAAIAIEPDGFSPHALAVDTRLALALDNQTALPQVVVLERVAWNDQATTAADLSTVQAFRDLFAGEALRPGEQLAIAHLALLFTDLRGSTELYRRIGDAPAFGRVLAHFDVLRAGVNRHEGALVKTIGDAIMAAFLEPSAAVRAALDILAAMREFNAGQPDAPLHLKMGLHAGPAIAVTLNERLDYFGTTVNVASRLEGQANGDDVVLSAAVLADPGVQAVLAERPVRLEPFRAQLRGFVDEEFALHRLTLAEESVPV